MKNVLAKGLIFGVLAGAFCVNCGEGEALLKQGLTKIKTGLRNLGSKAKYSKDEEKKLNDKLINYQRKLNELKGQLADVQLQKKRKNTNSLKKMESSLTAEIGETNKKIRQLNEKLAYIESFHIDVDRAKTNAKRITDTSKQHGNDIDKYAKNRNEGNLNAAKNSNANLLKLAIEQGITLRNESSMTRIIEEYGYISRRRLEAMTIQGANHGRSQDGQDYRVPTNYGRPGEGDYYLNSSRNDSGLRRNEYNNRLTPANGARTDSRQDPNFRYDTTISPYSHERIGEDPEWALQEGKYYRTGNNGSSAQGNRSIQRTSSLTRLGENSSGSQSRVLNRNSSQGNLGNYSPAKKSDLDWDSDGGFGDVNYHEGTSMMR